MKKITILLCFAFISAISVFSQQIKYELSIKYDQDQTSKSADITITVSSGAPEFTYYLTTNHPVNSKILFKSDLTKKRSYTFKGITPGTYFIKVEDSSGEQTGESIIIDENQN